MSNQLDTLLQTMRDALEKLERAVQLPTRKDFESMTDRVKELSRRIDQLEKNGPKTSPRTGSAAGKKRPPKK